MSVNKLGIIFLCGFLTFATVPYMHAQSTAPSQTQPQPSKKQSTMQHGTAQSSDIRKAQQVLADQGMYTGTVDGKMNAETQKALREYQQKNNLPVTGTLNHETMMSLGVGPQQPGQRPQGQTTKPQGQTKPQSRSDSSATTQQSTGESTYDQSTSRTTTTKQHKGSKGKQTSSYSKSQVREVQTALKQQGFDPGPIDGVMGPMTMTAIRNFQSHNGLQVTGNINSETHQALMQTGTATTSTSQMRTQTTQRQKTTMSSDQIRHVQQALADLQYDPGEINGMMTAKTQQAIREFQYLNNQPVTGNLDDQTLVAIDAQARGSQNIQRAKPGVSSDQQALPRTDTDQTTPDVTPDQQTRPNTDVDHSQPGISSDLQTRPEDNIDRPQSSVSSDLQSGAAAAGAATGAAVSPFYSSEQDTTTNIERSKPGVSPEQQTQSQTQTGNQTTTPTGKTKHDKKSKDQATTGKVDKDVSERVTKATEVLTELTSAGDKGIPNAVLGKAEAIAVIPHMMKGAFGIGGTYGKGLVSQRMDNGQWSAPAFITIGGGSFGAQLGASATDLVLVFTDRNALNLLEKGNDLKLGADASVAAGPVGRSAEAGTNLNLAGVLSYSRTKGAFAGVALDGSILHMDKDTNAKVYGSSADAREILNGNVAMNSTVQPFVNALDRLVPKKRISQK
jgi:lipid-binding SYLF domain-containing protein